MPATSAGTMTVGWNATGTATTGPTMTMMLAVQEIPSILERNTLMVGLGLVVMSKDLIVGAS